MRNLWASFDFLVHFLIIFFYCQSLKNEISSKILDTQKYNIVRHWFSLKNWIFAIFFKKVSIDGFTHYLWKILLIFIVSKMKFHQKSLIHKNTTLYDIDFPQKIGFLRFFLRKFLLTVLHIFHRKYTPNFQKIDFSIYPNILYICDQNFMLVPTIKLLEFSDKNWETYERLLIFWSIFWLFFLLSKVSKMKFHQKSLIHKNTTLYDIDFPQKIGFFRFFLRKFLLTVLHIFHRKYTPNFQKIDFSIYPNILYICDQNFMLVPTIKLLEFSDKNWETYERLLIFWSIFWLFFLLSKVSKMKFASKILDIQKYNIVRHWFSSKNWIFAIFFKKVSKILTVFQQSLLFMENIINFYCPKFQKWNFIKNPWYTKIQHCTTLIFLKKLDFFDFF